MLLAKALGYGFLDTDLVIQQREGALLQEILDEKGVPYFLDAEEQAVCSVECEQYVIAPGGSVVCREGAMAHLKGMGPVLYLRVPLEELKARIHNLDSRGIALEPGQTLAIRISISAPPCMSATPTRWWMPHPASSWPKPSLLCWSAWSSWLRRCSGNPSPQGTVGRPWGENTPELNEKEGSRA